MAPSSGLALVPTLSEAKLGAFVGLADGLSSEALLWLSGYAAGLAARSTPTAANAAPSTQATPQAAPTLTIVYGSQTGNSRRIAEGLAARLEAAGVATRLFRADIYPTPELKREKFLQVVISTQGDGDPPDDARSWFEFVTGSKAPRLPSLKFGVLGLGDSSYPKFCETARLLDARLEQLGASRWHALAQADVDIDAVADPWLEALVPIARSELAVPAAKDKVTALRAPSALPAISRARPFNARVLANQRITGRDSDRDTRHVELSLENSGLEYEPGDALGVWPTNPSALVDEVLRSLRLDGDEPVEHSNESHPLRAWLEQRRELTRLDRPFLARHAALSGDETLARLLEPANGSELREWLGTRQPIDVIQGSPAHWTASTLVAALRPLAPRLYSIASSRKAVGEEAHLVVGHVEYENAGARRWGAASHYLATRIEEATASIFIEANERFRLPADGSRDIIMIGAGTGIAPFRGFVQERSETGARGRNWLVFGNPRFSSDFLYQLEWQRALRQGQLQRLDLAFSRDGAQRTYVQQRLREQASQLRAWIDKGAYLYVCGKEATLGRDVHATLLGILGDQRDELQREGRYLRDVY